MRRGCATSVSSAITARRWTSNGLKPGPWSRATSASRASSSSTKTWWYLRHSSPSHWTVSVSGATTRQRSARPVRSRRLRIRQASTVLPRPTSSASSQRTGSLAVARSAACSWCGKRRMRPPRKEPRPRASRSSSRCSASKRFAKSSTGRGRRGRAARRGRSPRRSARARRLATSRPSASRTRAPSSRASTRASWPVEASRTLRPGGRSRRCSAGSSAARRSTAAARGNSTTTVRPSIAATRPGPSAGLWRCTSRSPTSQVIGRRSRSSPELLDRSARSVAAWQRRRPTIVGESRAPASSVGGTAVR